LIKEASVEASTVDEEFCGKREAHPSTNKQIEIVFSKVPEL
jgi:hypothetical protein